MKEPHFNELSIMPLCVTDEEVETRINGFAEVLEFCGFLGFERVRFDRPAKYIKLKEGYSLKEYLSVHARGNNNQARLMLSMLQPPYIEGNTIAEDRYITHTARLKREGQEIEAEGLATAYFSEGFAVGFASEDFWRNNIEFTLLVKDDISRKRHEQKIFCISALSQFSDSLFMDWAINSLQLQFRPSRLHKDLKTVKLRDDHGKNLLEKFSSKIIKESYVVSVINSLPFECNIRKMTRIKEDCSLIEVRMLSTENKIGIVVQTTAQNGLEAAYIAADIERKYS